MVQNDSFPLQSDSLASGLILVYHSTEMAVRVQSAHKPILTGNAKMEWGIIEM